MRRGDGEFFAPCRSLEPLLAQMCSSLYQTDNLKGLHLDQFIGELARFYDELNCIHPFREGNGRTQRLLWSRVTFDAGWILDGRPIHGNQLNRVSQIAREERDLQPLPRTLADCVTPRRP